jgi:nitrous oxidase accessory protein
MRRVFAAGIIILFIGTFFVSGISLVYNPKLLNRGWLYVGGSGPGNYSAIQSAINSANTGDTIYVYNGVYQEQIHVTKSLFLKGQNNINTIVIGGFNVTADYTTIQNFNITGGYEWDPDGVGNDGSNKAGIYVYSSHNSFTKNNINNIEDNNGEGESHNGGFGVGIYLKNSNYDNITQNIFSEISGGSGGNPYGQGGEGAGINLDSSNVCNITQNIFSNIIGGTGGNGFPGAGDGGNAYGVTLKSSSQIKITSNIILHIKGGDPGPGDYVRAGNGYAIALYSSTSNTLYLNSVDNITGGSNSFTQGYGSSIYYQSSLNNLCYNNIFRQTAFTYTNENNRWNITKTAGTNIIGGSYLGGNYWSDYTGTDNNNDGLGDTPYPIYGSNNYDYYPLVSQRPIADAGGPYTGFYNEGIVFDASGSYAPNGDPLEYNWDFDNDGVWDTGWLSSATIRWYYDDEYTGEVKLQVRDTVNPPVEDITTVNYWRPYYFIHITDPHVTWYQGDVWEKDIELIQNMSPPPDFVLCTGDLVDFGEFPDGPFNYDSLLTPLHGTFNNFYIDKDQNIPIYFCPGNHDAMTVGDFYNYYDKIGPDYWKKTHKNCAIFSLNTGKNIWECGESIFLPEGDGINDIYSNELTDFANQLAMTNEEIKIVMIHHPYIGLLQPPNQEKISKNTRTSRDQKGHIIEANHILVGGGDEIDVRVHIQDNQWEIFADEYRVYIYDDEGNQRDFEPVTFWKNLNGNDCWLTVSSNNDPFWDTWDLGATYRIELWEQHNGLQDTLWMMTPGLPLDGVFWDGRSVFMSLCNNNHVKMVYSGHMHNINRIVTIGEDTEQITTKAIHGGGNYYRIVNISSIYPKGYNINGMTAFSSTINGEVKCKTNVHIYDELGNHNGFNSTGEIERQIPISTYSFWTVENQTENNNMTHTDFTLTKNNSKNYTIVIESISNTSMNASFFSSDIRGNWTEVIYSNVTMFNGSTATVNANQSMLNYSMMIIDPDRESRIVNPTIINENYPPVFTENLTGSTDINTGEKINYSITAFDPNSDDLYYWFDWGDGTNTSWLSPYHSNETCIVEHAWNKIGNYEIKVKTKDDYNLMGNSSVPLIVQVFGNVKIKDLQSKWNFVSLPFNQSVSKTNLLIKYNGSEYSWQEAVNESIILGFIYAWNRGTQNYELTDTLDPGRGYWVYTYQDCELWAKDVSGLTLDPLITNLLPTWNIIGIPHNEPVEKQNLTILYNGTLYTWQEAVANTIILGFIYGWDETGQNYQLIDVLQPGRSYWMYAYYDSTLLWPTI